MTIPKVETIILAIILGVVSPIAFFLAGWWLSLGRVPDQAIFKIASVGFCLGLILDAINLKKWVAQVYTSDLKLLLLIFLFYSIGTYGFFMGVPVFNLGPGILAGLYMGRRLHHTQAKPAEIKQAIWQTSRFTTLTIALFSVCSAVIALSDPYTGGNLRGMLRLNFEVTEAMILGLILAGGIILLGAQYWLTRLAANFAFNFGTRETGF